MNMEGPKRRSTDRKPDIVRVRLSERPRGPHGGDTSYVCAAEKGSPFGEAENFQALESPNPRSFWYLSYDPIDGQDIFELRVLDE